MYRAWDSEIDRHHLMQVWLTWIAGKNGAQTPIQEVILISDADLQCHHPTLYGPEPGFKTIHLDLQPRVVDKSGFGIIRHSFSVSGLGTWVHDHLRYETNQGHIHSSVFVFVSHSELASCQRYELTNPCHRYIGFRVVMEMKPPTESHLYQFMINDYEEHHPANSESLQYFSHMSQFRSPAQEAGPSKYFSHMWRQKDSWK